MAKPTSIGAALDEARRELAKGERVVAILEQTVEAESRLGGLQREIAEQTAALAEVRRTLADVQAQRVAHEQAAAASIAELQAKVEAVRATRRCSASASTAPSVAAELATRQAQADAVRVDVDRQIAERRQTLAEADKRLANLRAIVGG